MVQVASQSLVKFIILVCLSSLNNVDGNSVNVQQRPPPFTSIQSCIDKLNEPGDECVIPGGRYHELVIVNNKHGTPNKPIIIRGLEDDYPIIDGTVQLKPKEG